MSSHARALDGSRLGYDLFHAAPTLPRIALIHSLAMDRRVWTDVAQTLSERASVLVMDCRGHGQSDASDAPYTTSLLAADLRDGMDALGWPSAVVAGASMGGCVALQFAADHPRRIDALGLVDTTAWYGPDASRDWAARATRASDEGLAALLDFQISRWFSDAFVAARPDIVQQCRDTFLSNRPAAFAASCRMLGDFDARSALSSIRVPTAIVVGEHDYATPLAMAQALHEAIEGSRLTVIPGARHLTPLESPAIVAAELERLLAQIGNRQRNTLDGTV